MAFWTSLTTAITATPTLVLDARYTEGRATSPEGQAKQKDMNARFNASMGLRRRVPANIFQWYVPPSLHVQQQWTCWTFRGAL
ncbi:hypothetical protein B0O80DRAFT_221189 [Mortierella sp. GBAus27b]|nr:hypothetical protein B0O80DRAFT_221189 [Mortierella sp. GBAus27b]